MTKKRDCICYQKYFWRDQCPLLEHKDHSFASSRFVPAVFGQTRKRALGQAWHTASLWLIAHRADIYICRPLLKIPVNPVASFSLCHVIGAREFSITCFPHGPWPCTLPLLFHSNFLARIFLLIPSQWARPLFRWLLSNFCTILLPFTWAIIDSMSNCQER